MIATTTGHRPAITSRVRKVNCRLDLPCRLATGGYCIEHASIESGWRRGCVEDAKPPLALVKHEGEPSEPFRGRRLRRGPHDGAIK